jgi:prephenate dehydrogenase
MSEGITPAVGTGASLQFSPLALLGVGYMGGSLALAARRAGLATEVVGYDPDQAAGKLAQERGIVTRMAGSAAEAVRGARLIVLAAPVRSLAPLARAIEAEVRPDALIIDIGSVKAPVVTALEATTLAGRFVGCHPLAGTEATGPAAADEALYRGRPCFLCPGPGTEPHALAAARELWLALGSSVMQLSPDPHDEFMAGASHLPHVGAFSLALSLEEDLAMLEERIAPQFPPTSLRDSTRVAASNPAVWSDILLENRDHLLPRVRRLEAAVAALRAAIEAGDAPALTALLARGRAARRRVLR